jgi:hypothetical protein
MNRKPRAVGATLRGVQNMGLSRLATNPDLPAQNGVPVPAYRSQLWYGAYMEALFEPQRDQIAHKIKAAEHLIIHRERELLATTGDQVEQNALINALHALRALRTCLGV